MSDTTNDSETRPKKRGKSGLILSFVLAVAGAGVGFALTATGLVSLGGSSTDRGNGHEQPELAGLPAVEFVDLSPIVLSLGAGSGSHHLRFHAQLEVADNYVADVEKMRPRIMDVLNSYLRAIEASDLQDPLALTRLRGHLLRRINIVVGDGRVRDVLVMEFVLS